MAKRYELADEAWDVVSDLFIETHGRGRPRLNDRLMLDGVLRVLCSGAAWRDLARANAVNSCSLTRATMPKHCAITAISTECNPSSRCAR